MMHRKSVHDALPSAELQHHCVVEDDEIMTTTTQQNSPSNTAAVLQHQEVALKSKLLKSRMADLQKKIENAKKRYA